MKGRMLRPECLAVDSSSVSLSSSRCETEPSIRYVRVRTGRIPTPTTKCYYTELYSMQSSYRLSLRSACKRYGPGRLPHADKPDIGAGYAAASAAVVATVLFGIVLGVYAVRGTSGDWVASFLFPALALPIVVPSAFFLGVVGWRLSPSSSSITGLVVGGAGAIGTYLVSLVLLGGVLTAGAVLSLSGSSPIEAAQFSASLVALAFIFTWWITIPVGSLSGLVYMSVTEPSP